MGGPVERGTAEGRTVLVRAAQGQDNLMPFILEAVKEYATLQEVMDVFREVFGEYQEPIIF